MNWNPQTQAEGSASRGETVGLREEEGDLQQKIIAFLMSRRLNWPVSQTSRVNDKPKFTAGEAQVKERQKD